MRSILKCQQKRHNLSGLIITLAVLKEILWSISRLLKIHVSIESLEKKTLDYTNNTYLRYHYKADSVFLVKLVNGIVATKLKLDISRVF